MALPPWEAWHTWPKIKTYLIQAKQKREERLLRLGVCNQLVNPPKPTLSNPICWIKLVFRGCWVVLDCQILFFYYLFIYLFMGGRVGCGSADSQIRLTHPNPPIFNIYFKNILYNFIIYSFVYQLSWYLSIWYLTN